MARHKELACFETNGWKVSLYGTDSKGVWKTFYCELQAKVEGRVRRKYQIAWNGSRFAASENLDSIQRKNPKLFAAINDFISENREVLC